MGAQRRVQHVVDVAVAGDYVLVGGGAAWLILPALREGLDARLRECGPEAQETMVRTYQALYEVAAGWQAKHAASPAGNGEAAVPEPSLVSESWCLSKHAAAMLGVTPRRVRQLVGLGDLTGRLRGGRLEVLEREVLELVERRAA